MARASSVASVLWIAGTVALLAPTVARWAASDGSLTLPRTPVDRVNELYARQWSLVQRAAVVVPEGETFTAIARSKDDEMLLFMLSLDFFRNHYPMPSSYWNGPVAQGDQAKYVVSYECLEPSGDARLVRRFPEGCVFERTAP